MKIVSLLVVENGLGECCGFVFEGSAIAQVQTRLKKRRVLLSGLSGNGRKGRVQIHPTHSS